MSGPSIYNKFSRRQLLLAGGGLAVSGLGAKYWFNRQSSTEKLVLRRMDSGSLGHRMRDLKGSFTPHSRIKTSVLIAGAGVSGLSAAYYLKKNKIHDFLIFENEVEPGGNSGRGENAVSAFPLGAHYLPILRQDDKPLMQLMQDFGVVIGFRNGLPVYEEQYLCSDPQERLFIKGRWQESLIPQYASDAKTATEMKEFLQFVSEYREKRGTDGKYIFSIPLDSSSQDPNYLKWDRISFADFLAEKGWTSQYVRWYADYCCRDDFGADAKDVSAWAGLHYFCSRNGRADNAEAQSVLTWPEGNNFLVQKLAEYCKEELRCGHTILSVQKTGHGYETLVYRQSDQQVIAIDSKELIYALPRFTAPYVLKTKPTPEMIYRPWIVASLTVDRSILETKFPLSWDTVRFGTETLGYVNATHQSPAQPKNQTVISFYHAWTQGSAREARLKLRDMSDLELQKFILTELEKLHPGIHDHVHDIACKVWGHGMIAPQVGFLWGQRRQLVPRKQNGIVFAHSDMSGISVFEEAHHQGYQAVLEILQRIKA